MRKRQSGRELHHFRSGRGLVTAFLCLCLLLAGCRGGRGSAGPGAEKPQEAPAENEQTETVEDASGGSTAGQAAAPADGPREITEEPGAGQDAASGSTAAQGLSATAEASAAATLESAPAVPGGNTGKDSGRFSAEGKDLVVVLDPGHSASVPAGEEPIGPGATEMQEADTEGNYGSASALHEYELTMRVCQKLRAELEERGYTVRLTHLDTLNPISNVERAQVANDNAADVFIQIHANGEEDTSLSGAGTVCITEDNPYHPELYKASSRLSEVLLDTYCEQTGAGRGKVRETDTMPSSNWSEVPTTIIELGYMSNPDEDLMMAMDSYQKKMVNAIADGLDKWFEEMPAEELAMHPTLNGQPRPGSEEDQDQAVSPASPTPAGTTPGAVPAGTNSGTEVSDPASREDASSGTGIPITVGGEEDSDQTDTEYTVREGSDTDSENAASSPANGEDSGEDQDSNQTSQSGDETGSADTNEETEEDLQEPAPGGVPFR